MNVTGAKITLLGLTATLLAGVSWPALAADGDGALETVVVTAERRDTTLLDTPVAVSAVNGDELKKRAFERVNDLGGLVAGLTVPNQNYANQTLFIRGVGSTIASGNPMVGFYIDDVFIARPFGIGWFGNLPDIEQVEVIRGPQGTLYGENSAAGAIKLISRTPTDDFRASAEVTGGNIGTFGAKGYVAGAIIPGELDGSLAYAHLQTGGPDKNPYLHYNQGGLLDDQGRGILRWTPSTGLEVVASVDFLRDRSQYRTAAPATAPAGFTAGPRTTFSDTPAEQPTDTYGATLHVSYIIDDNLTFKSISATRSLDNWAPNDTDGLPTYISGFSRHVTSTIYSQELQLLGDYGDLQFTTGFSYYNEVLGQYRFSWANNVFSGQQSQNDSEDLGLYGQAKYKLTDQLTATLGIRFNREVKGMDSYAYKSNLLGATTSLQQIAQAPGTNLGTIYTVSGLTKTYWATTPRVGLDYKITPDILLYADFASGQSSGGWNQASGSLTVASVPVDPQKVDSYEAGIKINAWDGRVFATLDGFYNDFKGYQATITNPVIGGVTQVGTIQVNAGNAHIQGGEFELHAKPFANLETTATLTLLDDAFDTYLNPTGAATSNYVGQELPYVPKTSAGVSATYTVPFADGSAFRLFGAWRYESSSFSDITPTRAQIKFPDQTYVDASLSYTFDDDKWTTSLNVKNLLDETYLLPLGGAYAPSSGLYGRLANWPRQITFTVRHEFD